MAAPFNLTAQINLQGPTNLKPIVSKIKRELGSITTDINIDIKASSARSIATITSRLKNLSTAARDANNNVQSLNQTLSQLSSGFSSISSATNSSVNSINKTTSSLGSAKKAVQQTRSEIEEFGKQSGLAIRRFAAFSTVTSVVYGLANAFTSAFKEFVVFNKEIVRLSQVTNQSVGDLKGVSDEITKLSTSLGVASSDLLEVSVTLAQAGLSAADTQTALEALAKSALAPSFESLKDTTEGSIAVLRQFGLQANELEGALGAINSVAAQFAVESSDLITAIQRTGGVFASASKGVSTGTESLNEFLAIFTSVRATTRESAETIATGLRTIFTRIQRGDTIDALKEYGVVLTDLEGKFVGPFEAVRRLSDGLNQLDPRDIRFAKIVEELGGFRQIGKVIPLIQQFTVAQEALKVAQKGQGSLAKDAITAQQSLAVQFTKTRENFLALVRELSDSTTFKALTDITFALANGLINLTRALEPLLPLLLTFTAIKLGSGLTQFASGFSKGFGGGGAAGLPTVGGGGLPSGGPAGAASNAAASVAANTTAITTLSTQISTLIASANALTVSVNQNNTLLASRPRPRGFARGGFVPGSGNRDTVPAMLTPGEFVISKPAVQAIGANNLANAQGFAMGGKVGAIALTPLNKKLSGTGKVTIGDIIGSLTKNTNLPGGIAGNKRIFEGKVSKQEAQKIIQDVGGFSASSPSASRSFTTQGEAFQKSNLAGDLTNDIDSSFMTLINNAGSLLADALQTSVSGSASPALVNSIGTADIIGKVFEGALNLLGAPFDAAAPKQDRDAFDFPSGLGGKLDKYFPGLGDIPTDAKKDLSAAILDDIATRKTKNFIAAQVNTDSRFQGLKSAPVKKASGGSISGSDTVPAMLTPGEFVINKSSAQSIGYSNLHKMNKMRGYNKGGMVGGLQHFAAGGQVGSLDILAIGSILTATLQPQIEKLAASFGKLDTEVSSFGTALSGAVKESTSLISSAAIGLSVTGASGGTRAAAIGGGALGGAVGGFLEAGAARNLELALKENARALNSFDKLVQEAASATTDKARIDAANKLEDAFAKLSTTFEKNQQVIDTSETWKAIGSAISDSTTTFLTLTTSLSALNLAVQSNVATQKAAGAANAFTGMGGAMGAAAQATAAAQSVGVLAKFGSALAPIITGLASFASGIGLVVGVLQIGYSLYSSYNNSLKKSTEESLKFADALRKTTEQSAQNSLANRRYTDVVIKNYDDLVRQRAAGTISEEQFFRTIGGLGQNTNQPNETNLQFRQLYQAQLQNAGIFLDIDKSINDFLNELKTSGRPENFAVASRVLKESIDKFTKTQFLAAEVAGGATPQEAQAKFNKLVDEGATGFTEIIKAVEIYTGKIDAVNLAQDSAALAAKQLQLSFVGLREIVDNFGAATSRIISETEASFKSADEYIASLGGQPRAGFDRSVNQRLRVLNNPTGYTEQELRKAINDAFSNISLTDPQVAKDFDNLKNETEGLILGYRAAKRELPTLLKEFAETPVPGRQMDVIREKIGALFENTTIDKDIQRKFVDSISESIAQGAKDNKPLTSIDDVLANFPDLGQAIKDSEKLLIDYSEKEAKYLDLLANKANQLADTLVKLNDIELSRTKLQNEIGNNGILGTEVRKALGDSIRASDLNANFNRELQTLTKGLVGSTNAQSIGQALLEQINLLEQQKAGKDIAGQKTTIANIRQLDTAFKLIVDSGTRLKIALDDLSAREKEIFQTPQQFFRDLIKDTGGEMSRSFQIGAKLTEQVRKNPNAPISKAEAAILQEFSDRFRGFGTEASTKIADQIDQLIIDRVNKTAGKPAGLQGTVGILGARDATAKAGFLSPEMQKIKAAADEINNGLDIQKQIGLKQIDSLQTSVDSYNAVMGQLRAALQQELELRQKSIELMAASTGQQVNLQNKTLEEQLRTTFSNIEQRAKEIGLVTQVGTAQRNVVGAEAGDFSYTTPKFGDFRPDSSFTTLEQGLAKAEQLLMKLGDLKRLQVSGTGLFGMGNRQANINDVAPLMEVLRNAINQIKAQQEQQKKTQLPTGAPGTTGLPGAAGPVGGASLDKTLFNILPESISKPLNTFMSAFEQSMNNRGDALGATLIESLGRAFLTFNAPVNAFKQTTEDFMKNLKSFNDAGGIKGPNIPQEVTVAVSFDENLMVQAERSNNNETLLTQIGILVQETVKKELTNLKVFG